MHQLYDGTSSSSEVFNQLADAYCLRALCTQEARSSSQKEIGCNTVVARISKAEKVKGLSSSIAKYILDFIKREDADSLSSDPIILVLDKEVQVDASMGKSPGVEKKEVYRMPSVASVSSALQRSCQRLLDDVISAIPLIDPSDACLLLAKSRQRSSFCSAGI
ncbi:hypothetical protein OROMI_005156 [Orobanche minor]